MPIPLIVIGGVILLFLMLLAVRIRIVIVLKDSVCVTLRVLFLPVRIYPRHKRVKWKRFSPKRAERLAAKKAHKAKKKAKKGKSDHQFADDKQEKTTLHDKLVLTRGMASALIRKTHKKLRLVAARLHIRVASNDAAKTAVLYGVVCQSLSYLLAALDRVTKLKAAEPEVSVVADFLSEKPSADVKLIFSVRVWGAIVILVTTALAHLRTKQHLKTENKQKQKAAAKAERARPAQKGKRHG